ncbi:MAG: class I SAM-dependent methyltransferase [Chloracidobacterium sp.]|nr:class I SAM-dependent methyltransferase [Chloracidobacterium sp.]MDW8217984.1 class I SAM-dependent methyltransferase [Acidobacteriota bacterium]
MEDPIKGLLAGDALAYLRVKADLFLDDLEQAQPNARHQPDCCYLDFGCGTGDFMHLLQTCGVRWTMFGYDASRGMLDEAIKRWPQVCSTDNLRHVTEPTQILPDHFDLITAICVFHHIPPSEWETYFAALYNGLRPRGRLYVFEHNPINPVTQIMVSRAEIDRDAVLLWPFSTVQRLRRIGFHVRKLSFFLYVPPRFSKLLKFERWFSKLPFGGQYMIVAEKA